MDKAVKKLFRLKTPARIRIVCLIFAVLTLMSIRTKAESNEMSIFENYILTYYKTAIRQQKKHKIPASITLAQGLLESAGGQSYLAINGNNHFGIKSTDWDGKIIYKNGDKDQGCYRKYSNATESYEDHSLFLKERIYYKSLFKLNITDYKGWANGLYQCGYATDPKYATKLIFIIEKYGLNYFDTANESDKPIIKKRQNTTTKR